MIKERSGQEVGHGETFTKATRSGGGGRKVVVVVVVAVVGTIWGIRRGVREGGREKNGRR